MFDAGQVQIGNSLSTPDAQLNVSFNTNNTPPAYELAVVNTTSTPTDVFTVDQNGTTQIGKIQATPSAALTICSPSPTGFASNQISVRDPGNIADVFTVTNGGIGFFASQLSIGYTSIFFSNYSLDVNGTIHANEVKVCNVPGCDFVFDKNYNLMPLDSLSSYLKCNHHLPGIASANEMAEEGSISLGEMDKQLLQKVEELTLYTIQQKDKAKAQDEKIEKQDEKIKDLEAKLDLLLKQGQK
jgi:hypothetical protein